MIKKKLLFFLLITISSYAQLQKGDVAYFVDFSSKSNIHDILSSNQFKIAPNNIPSLGFNPNAVWTKISVRNISQESQKCYVQIGIPYMDTVQYFVIKNSVLIAKSEKMGWWSNLNHKQFQNPNHPFSFSLNAHDTIEIYARTIKLHGTVRVLLQVDTESEFLDEIVRKGEFWGWFLGMGFVVMFLNLFIYLLVQEKVYLYYTFYVFSQIFNLDSREVIHPNLYMDGFWGISGRSIHYLSMVLIVISNILFVNSYLRVKELQPQIFTRLTQFMVFTSLLFTLMLLIPESIMVSVTTQKTFISIFTASFFLSIIFTFSLIFYAILKNKERKAAILYLVAGLPILVVAIIQMLGNIRLLPIQNFQRNNNLAMTIAFEIVVLCFWLANRFKVYADEREKLLQDRTKQQKIALETGLQLQNQERSRLAKELHDGVGIDISIIKMKLEALRLDFEKKGADNKELNDTIMNLDDVASDIRSFSHNLMPPDLESNGIVYVLQNLVYNLQKLHPTIEINFTTNIEEKVADDLSQHLYFITKELINNALKYSKATIIDIELMQENNKTELKVADNGIGYDFKKTQKNGGLGLKSIMSRVELMGAQFDVFEKPSKGVSHQLIKQGA